MTNSIQVLLADDHALIRIGVRTILTGEPDITVVAEATDGDSAQRLSQEFQPDILILDLRMPGPPAMDTIAYVRQHCTGTKILVLTAHNDGSCLYSLLKAGISGYVLKDEAPAIVIEAIRNIMRGAVWVSPAAISPIVTWIRDAGPGSPNLLPTDRELQVLQLVAQGWTNRQIAQALAITERTVRFHVEQLFGRAGANNRTQLVHIAQQQRWLDLPQGT